MIMKKIALFSFVVTLMAVALTSCMKSDNNDSKILYSQIGMINTNGDAKVASGTLDDGSKLIFSPTVESEWAKEANKSYRAQMYFYMSDEQMQEGNKTGTYQVEPVALQEVLNFKIHSKEEAKEWIGDKDPVGFLSGWRNYGYVNMHLVINAATAEEVAKHTFGVVLEEQKYKNKVLRLCHKQNGVTTAYSSDLMASIPVKDLAEDTDTVTVIIPTAKGDNLILFLEPKKESK